MELESFSPSLSSKSPVQSKSQNRQHFEQGAFHRWYNFILGFSDKAVEHLLDRMSVQPGDYVMDPFCGTGTTLIECAKRGILSVGLDANPFAIFAANAKSQFSLDPSAINKAAARVARRFRRTVSTNLRFTNDPVFRYLNESGMLDRGWISRRPLRKALILRQAILCEDDPNIADVLMLALTADLAGQIGNMKFGPQIYRGEPKNDVDVLQLFRQRIAAVVEDLRDTKGKTELTRPRALLGDARRLKPSLRAHFGSDIPPIDFVISSPPYPTEHDYTRHTRLELAFIEGVATLACLRKIKRSMIRSHTKGIYVGDEDEWRVARIKSVKLLAQTVQHAVEERQSGFEKLYPTVVKAYFGGMRRHFGSLYRLMRSGGKAAYIVGDQAAYLQIPVRTALLLGEVAESVGFRVDNIELWRRRWATGIASYLEENILFLSKR